MTRATHLAQILQKLGLVRRRDNHVRKQKFFDSLGMKHVVIYIIKLAKRCSSLLVLLTVVLERIR